MMPMWLAMAGDEETLRWAVAEEGCPFGRECYWAVAANGMEGALGWLAELSPTTSRWNRGAAIAAALSGHTELALRVAEGGKNGGPELCAAVARTGDVDALKRLRDMGYAFDAGTCGGAAMGGQLDTLRWLRAGGCPWDARTCAGAALSGHIQTLRWALANGCACSESAMIASALRGDCSSFLWCIKSGCTWDGRVNEWAIQLAARTIDFTLLHTRTARPKTDARCAVPMHTM